MTDQLETYLRDQFATDAERAPLARDLAVAARRRARQQRRRAASLVAAALIVPAVLAGLAYGLGATTRTAAPPAHDSTSATVVSTPPPVSRGLPNVLNGWLEQPNAYTADIASIPWGGRIYCDTALISASRNADNLYVWALCAQVYVKDGEATLGSTTSAPVVMHVTHHVAADRSLVVDHINGIDYPHDDTYQADIDQLFPARIVNDIRTERMGVKPSQADLLARAQADVEAGEFSTFSEAHVVAARVLAYARGTVDTIPADAPIRLYLGNKYQTMVRPDRDGRLDWNMCATYAGRDCPMSALTTLVDADDVRIGTPRLNNACLDTLSNPPNDTGGSLLDVLTPGSTAGCTKQFAVEIWTNDVSQITAVNLLLGSP
jgi:hypothetical protein